MITYPKVTEKDAAFLLRLKNQKDVRLFSIVSHEKILKENHLKWLKKTLENEQIDFRLIVLDGKPAGDVRVDRNEISIRICPWARGFGLGRNTIKKFKKKNMMAKIVDGNIRSMRLFFECGFQPICYMKGVYFFTCV